MVRVFFGSVASGLFISYTSNSPLFLFYRMFSSLLLKCQPKVVRLSSLFHFSGWESKVPEATDVL